MKIKKEHVKFELLLLLCGAVAITAFFGMFYITHVITGDNHWANPPVIISGTIIFLLTVVLGIGAAVGFVHEYNRWKKRTVREKERKDKEVERLEEQNREIARRAVIYDGR